MTFLQTYTMLNIRKRWVRGNSLDYFCTFFLSLKLSQNEKLKNYILLLKLYAYIYICVCMCITKILKREQRMRRMWKERMMEPLPWFLMTSQFLNWVLLPSGPGLSPCVSIIWECTQRIPKDFRDRQEFRRILVSTTKNFSNVSLLKLLWKSYFWNQFLFFSPHILSSLSPSSNKYICSQTQSKIQTEGNTARDSGCPQITPNTDLPHIQSDSWSPGQLLKLGPVLRKIYPSDRLACIWRNNLKTSQV